MSRDEPVWHRSNDAALTRDLYAYGYADPTATGASVVLERPTTPALVGAGRISLAEAAGALTFRPTLYDGPVLYRQDASTTAWKQIGEVKAPRWRQDPLWLIAVADRVQHLDGLLRKALMAPRTVVSLDIRQAWPRAGLADARLSWRWPHLATASKRWSKAVPVQMWTDDPIRALGYAVELPPGPASSGVLWRSVLIERDGVTLGSKQHLLQRPASEVAAHVDQRFRHVFDEKPSSA